MGNSPRIDMDTLVARANMELYKLNTEVQEQEEFLRREMRTSTPMSHKVIVSKADKQVCVADLLWNHTPEREVKIAAIKLVSCETTKANVQQHVWESLHSDIEKQLQIKGHSPDTSARLLESAREKVYKQVSILFKQKIKQMLKQVPPPPKKESAKTDENATANASANAPPPAQQTPPMTAATPSAVAAASASAAGAPHHKIDGMTLSVPTEVVPPKGIVAQTPSGVSTQSFEKARAAAIKAAAAAKKAQSQPPTRRSGDKPSKPALGNLLSRARPHVDALMGIAKSESEDDLGSPEAALPRSKPLADKKRDMFFFRDDDVLTRHHEEEVEEA